MKSAAAPQLARTAMCKRVYGTPSRCIATSSIPIPKPPVTPLILTRLPILHLLPHSRLRRHSRHLRLHSTLDLLLLLLIIHASKLLLLLTVPFPFLFLLLQFSLLLLLLLVDIIVFNQHIQVIVMRISQAPIVIVVDVIDRVMCLRVVVVVDVVVVMIVGLDVRRGGRVRRRQHALEGVVVGGGLGVRRLVVVHVVAQVITHVFHDLRVERDIVVSGAGAVVVLVHLCDGGCEALMGAFVWLVGSGLHVVVDLFLE